MRNILIAVLLLVAVLSVSCSAPVTTDNSEKDLTTIQVTIRDDGISITCSDLRIDNYRAGKTVPVVYQVHNATSKAVEPDIFINPDADVTDYSKADGAVNAPSYATDWIILPEMSDVTPGEIKDFEVAFRMPKDAEKQEGTIAYQIGAASKSREGMLQPAVATWWLVTMR